MQADTARPDLAVTVAQFELVFVAIEQHPGPETVLLLHGAQQQVSLLVTEQSIALPVQQPAIGLPLRAQPAIGPRNLGCNPDQQAALQEPVQVARRHIGLLRQQGSGQGIDQHLSGQRVAAFGQFLEQQALCDPVHAKPTLCLGDNDTRQAEFGHRLGQFQHMRVGNALIAQQTGHRVDLMLDEGAHAFDRQRLCVRHTWTCHCQIPHSLGKQISAMPAKLLPLPWGGDCPPSGPPIKSKAP
ncbi:hypothetical protein D9M71_228060 [compost metagenome]